MTFKFPGLAYFLSGMVLTTSFVDLIKGNLLTSVWAFLLSAGVLVIAWRSR